MSDNLLASISTPYEVQQRFAQVLKHSRRKLKHSRREASLRTGIPEATIRRFEETGAISLRQFLVLWDFYEDLQALDQLTSKSIHSLDDLTSITSSKP